jgi:DNA-binding protein HU-beta/integration host factor subunit beta
VIIFYRRYECRQVVLSLPYCLAASASGIERRAKVMPNITKKDLVEKIAEKTGLTQVDTKIVVESFLDAVSKALQQGRNIEIRGFGRFKIKEKKERTARNPRTNQYIKVEAGYKPIFEASKELRKRVDASYWGKSDTSPRSQPGAAPASSSPGS